MFIYILFLILILTSFQEMLSVSLLIVKNTNDLRDIKRV
jgi:hypothetical protein